jgi:ABC-type transporter Mla MlaB component
MAPAHRIDLRLHSGIPVLDVWGDWASALSDKLSETIGQLARAGHYEIIVNMQRAAKVGAATLSALTPMARLVRAHHGHVEIVATAEQLSSMAGAEVARHFRMATSEASAIGRIKGQPVRSESPSLTAHVNMPSGTR